MEIAESDDGGYLAYVKEWPGCVAQGETLAEAEENIKDTAEAFLATLIERRIREHVFAKAVDHIGRVRRQKKLLVDPKIASAR
jgi:predicted RNase H-like HicB family nuclease